MPKITAKSWNRFITSNFCVTADLMGSSHKFEYEGYHVQISLPLIEHANRDSKYDEVASIYSSKVEPYEPISFFVLKVDIKIQEPSKISVPEEALTRPPNQEKYFSSNEKKSIDKITKDHSKNSKRVFIYWLEIMRWASSNALIGQERMQSNNSGWSTYLINAETNHRIWAGGQSINVELAKEVTKQHWITAEEYLNDGKTIPMHISFLHTAEWQRSNKNYEKSIVELAMACETYLRYSVFEHIPEELPEQLVTYIEEANINKYASQFFKKLIPDSQKKEYNKLQKDISSLMSKRNSYLHMGFMDNANITSCNRYIKSMKKLFEIKLITGEPTENYRDRDGHH